MRFPWKPGREPSSLQNDILVESERQGKFKVSLLFFSLSFFAFLYIIRVSNVQQNDSRGRREILVEFKSKEEVWLVLFRLKGWSSFHK